jgi:hypothetical protein
MSHFEEVERYLPDSELFKSFKLNIISNNRSNFLSSEKLDTCVSFEGSLFYVDDYGGNRPGFNVSFKSLKMYSDNYLSGYAEDVFEKRFEPKYTEEDTRGPSPLMEFDLKRRKKVKDEEPDYSGRLVDKIPGFKAVIYSMNCWIRHDKETGSQCLEGTLTNISKEIDEIMQWDGCIYPPEID